MSEKLKINIIKTDSGKCFVSDCHVAGGYDYDYHRTKIDELIFDGEKAKQTYLKNWFEISKYPEKIQIEKHGEMINRRYELKDKDMASKKLPAVIKFEDRDKYDEDIIYSLYKFASEQDPDSIVDFDCELVLLCEIENFKDVEPFNYKAIKKCGFDDKVYTVTNLNIKHSLVDKIILPEPILAGRPCKLSSKEMYDITRQFIKDNIDQSQARISSDYDSCFQVEKIIPLLAPETMTYQNILARTKKERSKIRYVTKKAKEETIFQMTHTQENYRGYTSIQEFTANNQDELKEKIDTFLNDLITVINKPMCICDKCNGAGYLEGKN